MNEEYKSRYLKSFWWGFSGGLKCLEMNYELLMSKPNLRPIGLKL